MGVHEESGSGVRTWPTMKGRSEKPSRAARREAPSQPPTSGTFDAALSARVYAASAPAHACAAPNPEPSRNCNTSFSSQTP